MNMEAGSRQVEGARGCHLQVSQGLHELMRLLQGSCSMLLSSSFLRDKSNQAGPWLDCDHQGTCKEKGKKKTKDEALRCIDIQMIRRGWGGGHETKKRGQGWRRRRRRNSYSWKKKKNKERGKILMAILSSLESHHTRGGLRTPKRKQYEWNLMWAEV